MTTRLLLEIITQIFVDLDLYILKFLSVSYMGRGGLVNPLVDLPGTPVNYTFDPE